MEHLVQDIPPALIRHFAAEARALDASGLNDYTLAKRWTLLACLIKETQMSTRDDLIEMFLTRMSSIQVKAKEALQRQRLEQQETTEQLLAVLTDLVETALEDSEQDDATAGKHLRAVLDVLWETNEENHWTRHFGPISGSDPKLSNPAERYVITSFAYGTNMGAAQLAKHMRGIVTEHEITFVNRRRITSKKLEAAKTDLINRYYLYDLPKCWGDETIAAADGTQIELYRNNLLSSYHIRYGSYGGDCLSCDLVPLHRLV